MIFFVEWHFGTSMRDIIFATCVQDICRNQSHSLNESFFSKKVKTVIYIPRRRRFMSCEKSSNRNSLYVNRDSMLSGSSKPQPTKSNKASFRQRHHNLPLMFGTLTFVGMFTFLLYFTLLYFPYFGVESTIKDTVLLARTRSRVVFVVYGRRTNQISDYPMVTMTPVSKVFCVTRKIKSEHGLRKILNIYCSFQ